MCPLQRPTPPKSNPNALAADADHRAKLQRLRQALADGTYRPQIHQIAARLIASGDLG